jgi:hypothetical protein
MNTTTFTITNPDNSSVEWVTIAHDDGSFTSMTKATYEATLASELSNPSTPQAGA